ncbi:MAG: pyrroline-5-carboxylate reductase [Aquificaceae bacterium]|nr:pyrroline-5-carboxylate reductase [Aquificaceae bacterium]
MKIGVIGYGNMGEAFAKALKGRSEILVYEIEEDKNHRALREGFGVAKELDFLVENTQWILLAVKPKDAVDVLHALKGKLEDKILISVVAGMKLSSIQELCESSKLIRLMPNINVLVRRAVIACAFGEVEKENRETFFNVFSACGNLYEIKEELFDLFTALAGSGPAFVFKFIHALALAGVRGGFSYEMAKSIALDTVLGSCQLLKSLGGHPEEWVTKVASPGGTTIEGIKTLEEKGFTGLVMECVERTSEKAKILL